MELGEGEAKICRLCGQCESIYIDVFGEEGTKRFLGLKIYTKINILIDERDPLPKAICVQCLGKLEFVCDFQEECLRTQQVLRDRYNLPPLSEIIKKNDGLPQIVCMRCLGTLEFLCDFYDSCHHAQKELSEVVQKETEDELQRENDAESDKENATPTIDTKRKALSPVINNCITKSNAPYSNIEKTNNDQTNTNTLENIVNTQSTLDNIPTREKCSMNRQSNGTKLKRKTNFTRKDAIMKKTSSRNLLREDETNVNENSVFPVRRKRGRKSKLEKMREAALLQKELQNVIDKRNNDSNNKSKRYCLRNIYDNTNFNDAIKSTIVLPKQVDEITAKEQVEMDSSSNETHTKDNTTNSNKSTKTKPDDENLKNVEDCSRKIENNLVKNKAISVIVKQEKLESEGTLKQTEKLSHLTWIPNEILVQENINLTDNENENQTDQQLSSSLRAEITNTETSKSTATTESNVTDCSNLPNDQSNLKPRAFTAQNRISVIKSSNETATATIEKDPLELCIKADTLNQNVEGDLKSSLTEQLLLQQNNQSNSSDDSKEQRKSKDKLFFKISELISDEEKQAIETYYTVDMSIVDHEEVQKNLTIVDKKNIRCNICGLFYLRIDKCQVHVWGHLQMKPYQCKACDFSTVTVTNIRGHIRKSHLKLKPFPCHICEKRYATAFLLDEHMNVHTGDRPYKCKLCDFSTSRRQMLSYHNSTHKVLKDVNCKVCGKEFYSRGRLRAHMIMHNKDKVICKLCSACLSNQEALETHHKNVHMQDYICSICGKRLKSKKALHNHRNVHAVGKYKCSLCPNVYKSSQILKEHLLKHKGIRNYKCNVCEKAFGQQSHLAAHMAVHSKIRFHCPGCDRPFNRHDNMKIHTKRCKVFLANPELKNFFIKRERCSSFTKVTELEDDLRSDDISTPTSPTFVESQNSELSTETIDNQNKGAVNFCKLGLNISCIEPVNKTWDHDLYEKTEVTRSTEINIIPAFMYWNLRSFI
nr:PREDICTED: zinc finger protein 26-like isoform X2 [Megachile rotundata]